MGLSQVLTEENDGKTTFTAITENGNSKSVTVSSNCSDSTLDSARDEAIEGALAKD